MNWNGIEGKGNGNGVIWHISASVWRSYGKPQQTWNRVNPNLQFEINLSIVSLVAFYTFR
jgi:hypothetical protein